MHCLPGAGGLLDQDYYYVWVMEKVASADVERGKREQALKGHS